MLSGYCDAEPQLSTGIALGRVSPYMGRSRLVVRRSPLTSLLRVMLDLGRYTLGVIVTSGGILLEIQRGRRRWSIALGVV